MFYVPQTGWNSSPGFGFWQTVDEIVKHRQKNPRFASQWSTDRNDVANELDFFTCLRINFDKNYCTPETGAVAPGGVKKKTPVPVRQWNFPSLLASAGAAGIRAEERVQNAAAGVGVVLDWLGDSLSPVEMELAEKRAQVCAVCPQNGRPDFIQKLESWAASGVRELLKLKTDLELKTSVDDKLHHCQACDCVISLKCLCKMEHIKAHTSQRVKDALDRSCWMLKEWDEA